MSKSHDIAWAAGFFDGDGYVTINRGFRQNKYICHILFVGSNHVAPEPLEALAKLFGGVVVLDQNSLKPSEFNRKPRYRWKITGDKAKEALICMMPYFRNKQQAAEIGIELANTLNKGSVTPEVIATRDILWNALKHLNSLD